MDTDTRTASGSGITCHHAEDGSYLILWGEVDAALREAASHAMASLAGRTVPLPITLDARDVTFIDSSGIAFILQVYMLGQETGAHVRLVEPAEAVAEILEMVGMGGRIPVVTAAEAAVC